MSEQTIENPLEGIPSDHLKAKSGSDFAEGYGYLEGWHVSREADQRFFDTMWTTAFAMGKAEGLAARDNALRTAAEERDEARATAKTETDQVLKLRAKVEEQRRSIEILREEVAAYQDNEKLLAQEKQDLAQIIEDIKSDVRYYASETLSGRRALATAVGFPEEYVVLPPRG
jgi:hypothetical protein